MGGSGDVARAHFPRPVVCFGVSPIGTRAVYVAFCAPGGDGRFARAQGLITSNFAVSADGDVTDNHFARIYLPGVP